MEKKKRKYDAPMMSESSYIKIFGWIRVLERKYKAMIRANPRKYVLFFTLLLFNPLKNLAEFTAALKCSSAFCTDGPLMQDRGMIRANDSIRRLTKLFFRRLKGATPLLSLSLVGGLQCLF